MLCKRSRHLGTNFKLQAEVFAPGTTLVSIGNLFPNVNPYYCSSGAQHLVSLGNRGFSAPAMVATLEDRISNVNQLSARTSFEGLRGLSTTTTPSKNLRGTFFCSQTPVAGQPMASVDPSGAWWSINFAEPEADSAYYLSVTPIYNTNLNYNPIVIVMKSTTGFTIRFQTPIPPGHRLRAGGLDARELS